MPDFYEEDLDGGEQALNKLIDAVENSNLEPIYKYGILITRFNKKPKLVKQLQKMKETLKGILKENLAFLTLQDLIIAEKYFKRNSSGKKVRIRKRRQRITIQELKDAHLSVCEEIIFIVACALTENESIADTGITIGKKG